MDNTLFDYENMVQSPGKFENESRYTPYFYDLMLNGDGFLTEDHNGLIITRFNIEKEDIKIFPELEKYHTLDLHITDDGFVISEIY